MSFYTGIVVSILLNIVNQLYLELIIAKKKKCVLLEGDQATYCGVCMHYVIPVVMLSMLSVLF